MKVHELPKGEVRTLALCAQAVLEPWPLHELAAFNLAVLLYGRIDPENLSFEKARASGLCEDDGSLRHQGALEMAVGAEMKRRGLIDGE